MPDTDPNWQCPPYSVRLSKRAQRISLRLSVHGELEVVLPLSSREVDVPALLYSKRAWLRKAQQRIARRPSAHSTDPAIPDSLHLAAIDETWSISHDPNAPARLDEIAQRVLSIGGNPDTARELLRQWLLKQGRRHLEPWLNRIAADTGIGYHGLTLRTQRGRWGSCSSKGRINLNAALLFLPAQLVRHVLVHELCHRRHLNHSARFWALVASHDPDYAKSRAAMRGAWQSVPGWLNAATRRR
ncbi:MAG: M48 family metallopeptidase [Gammaproteobacteria bacterium]|nr:M48 family metallopeptidase [Gammaproteobacteria bacterium]MCP5135931.1 M48 family metallopeptidase [Gammaproteobacteria bacterium]